MRRALSGLEAEGWRLRHSLLYRGGGDIDSVAIAPTGLAFAIETKTRTFDARHLANTRDTAAWLCRHRRRWCRAGSLGVLCVVGARSLERVEDDVLIVSLERLLPRYESAPEPRRARSFSPRGSKTADRRACPHRTDRSHTGAKAIEPPRLPASNRRKWIVAEAITSCAPSS